MSTLELKVTYRVRKLIIVVKYLFIYLGVIPPSHCVFCSLPDDDRDICVFDYYVDESGEWDPWQSRVPEAGHSDTLNMLGDVFVDTVETVSVT